jgi:hypothetical protein
VHVGIGSETALYVLILLGLGDDVHEREFARDRPDRVCESSDLGDTVFASKKNLPFTLSPLLVDRARDLVEVRPAARGELRL